MMRVQFQRQGVIRNPHTEYIQRMPVIKSLVASQIIKPDQLNKLRIRKEKKIFAPSDRVEVYVMEEENYCDFLQQFRQGEKNVSI